MDVDLTEIFDREKKKEQEMLDIKIEKDKLVFETPKEEPKTHDQPYECEHC